MKKFSFLVLLISTFAQADTINKYMQIEKSIPQMKLKTDARAQAWARASRNILTMADENIAQTITAMNELAKKQGHALLCLPAKDHLSGEKLHQLLLSYYQSLSIAKKQQNPTVSEVALDALRKAYPCQNNTPKLTMGFNSQNYQIKSVRREQKEITNEQS